MNIAIIPARCGSKSIPNKNLQKIGGKSLVDRAVLSAKEANIFHKIILTTDIPTVADEYKDDKDVIVRPRLDTLGTDTAEMRDVVLDVLKCFKFKNPLVWLLQPTSPFRERKDYEDIQEAFKNNPAKSLISLNEVYDNHPNRMYTIKNNILHALRFTSFSNKQSLPTVYIRSGHYYVFYQDDFLREKSFYIHPCKWLLVPQERAINIDGPMDLLLAQKAFEARLCR